MTEDEDLIDDEIIPCYNCESLFHAYIMASHYHNDERIFICPECDADE